MATKTTIKFDRLKIYEEGLCRKVNDPSMKIWNSDWLKGSIRNLVDCTPIVDENIIQEIDTVINIKEVQLFISEYD